MNKSIKYRKPVFRHVHRRGKTRRWNTWNLFGHAVRATFDVVQLIRERAPFLPAGAFRPNEQHFAFAVYGKTGMLSALSLAWSGRRLACSVSVDPGPVDLAPGLPGADESACVLRKIHAAHRTRVDVPFVEQSTLEGLAAIP